MFSHRGSALVSKRLFSLITLFILIICTSTVSFAADNPQDTITNNKMKFQQMNDNIMETNKQISELNIKISKTKGDINKNNADIDKNNKAIEAEKLHMEQLIEEINQKQEVANKRLRAMYINGYNENLAAILLTSESFSDLISRYEIVKNIVSYDKKVFDDLTSRKKSLKEAISDLDNKLQKLQELKNNNLEKLQRLDNDKKKLQELISEFDKEKALAAQAIKENEEKLIAHSISVIDSSSSTIPDMKSALQTLNSLVSQISTDSVKNKAKDYIASGNKKLADMIAKEPKPSAPANETYKATYTMQATAYTGGTLTALGLKPVRDPSGLSTIAVDPSVIPLGSKVYIPGYGYAICSDTGSAIKGNIIDLYLNSEDECINWGRRNITLYIVAYPGEW